MLNTIDSVVNTISGVLYQPYVVPLILVLAGLYFTFRLKFVQIRLFAESIHVVKEKPINLGATSSFGALMVSTASRVGTGNIMGVSTALCLGGPSYYMEQALGQRWLGVIFAIVLILTYVVGYNMLAAYNTQSTFAGFGFYDKNTS